MASSGNSTIKHPIAFRILHETIIVSIILLIITGFYIHRPFVDGGGFLMSLTRGTHFFFAVVLIIAVVIRLISMFIGPNRDWRSFIPTFYDFMLLPKTIGYYLHICKEPETKKKYKPTQMLSYCVVFLMIIFQIISGLALNYPDGAFSWFNYGLFNNEIQARIAHFIVTWMLMLFMMIHIYLAIRESFAEIKQMHLLSGDEKED